MSRRRTPARTPLTGTVLPGVLLVVALVVALPATLAFCPADALGLDGAGAGTGDLVAAALSGLDRDLHGTKILPAPARDPHASVAALAAWPWPATFDRPAARGMPDPHPGPRHPADALAGPGPDGYPFLL